MQITLCFPYASSDRAHAAAQLRLLKKFGPYLEDRALILPTPSAYHDPELRAVVDELATLFAPEHVAIEVTPNDFKNPPIINNNWPFGPNCHFRFAADMMEQKGYGTPFIFFEADLYPIRENWLKLVKEDYLKGGTPFRGMIERTRWIDTHPTTKARTVRYDGYNHLVGAAIYPANYLHYLCPNGNAPMACHKAPSRTVPFDVKCQHEHLPATQSPLWLHKPRTKNWKLAERPPVGDTPFLLSCEDVDKDEFGLSYAGVHDAHGVCLIHGPKDSSLADALLSPSEPVKAAPTLPTEAEKALMEQFETPHEPAPAPTPLPLEGRLFLLEEENQRLIDELEALTVQNRQLTERLQKMESPTPAAKTLPKKPGRPRKALATA